MVKTCCVTIVCLILFSAIDCARNPDKQLMRRRAALRCLVETRARYSVVKKFQNGEFSDSSDKSKCFLKCYGAKLGIFDESDAESFAINEELLLSHLDDIVKENSQIPRIVDSCKVADKGENTCDYAFNAYKCFYEEVHNEPGLIDPSEASFDEEFDKEYKKLKENKFMLRLKDEDDDFLDISLDELDAALAG